MAENIVYWFENGTRYSAPESQAPSYAKQQNVPSPTAAYVSPYTQYSQNQATSPSGKTQAQINAEKQAFQQFQYSDPKSAQATMKQMKRSNFLSGIDKAYPGIEQEDKDRIISQYDSGTLNSTVQNQIERYVQSDPFGEVVKTPQYKGYAAQARRLTKNEVMDAMDDDPSFRFMSTAMKQRLASEYLTGSVAPQRKEQIMNAISPWAQSQGWKMGEDGTSMSQITMAPPGYGTPEGEDIRISEDGKMITGTPQTAEEQARLDAYRARDPYSEKREEMQAESDLYKERLTNALNGIDQALASGQITQAQADAFKTAVKGWDFKKEINLDNIISEFQRIGQETIDPQFQYVIGDTISQLQTAKQQLDRSKQERLRQTEQQLEASGRTFSGEGTRLLGEESALGQQGQQGELQKDYTENLTEIRRLAEQKLGSEKARQIGFEPLQGGFEGTIQQERSGVEAGVASQLFGQAASAAQYAQPQYQNLIPENLYKI